MIENARYTESGSIIAVIDGVPVIVPDDMANRHRQMLAELEVQGNTIAPYSPPVLTPEERRSAMQPLTPRQIRLGLVNYGISLSQVESAIASLPDPQQRAIAEIEWEYASQFVRTHPLIDQVGTALGLTPEQIDAMWEAALGL